VYTNIYIDELQRHRVQDIKVIKSLFIYNDYETGHYTLYTFSA